MIKTSPLLFVAALLILKTAEVAPRSIDDCEKIKEAEAYNLCLASFGPVRGQHNKTYPGLANDGAASAGGRQALPPTSRLGVSGRHSVNRSHLGRMRLELKPKHR
ncbi:MAG: hypothetical protein ACKOB7_05655 [Methylocystis sp.]|nr:hypothetical protein [Alphaproteobacteria bacterium]